MALPFLATAGGAALISGVGGLLGNALGGIFGNKSGKRQLQAVRETNQANLQMNEANNQLQRELAQQKYDKDLEQWNRQNEYNAPTAQKQRLLDAGLNPALQNVSTGVATSSPEMAVAPTTAGRVEAPQYIPPNDYGLSQVGNVLANSFNQYYQTLNAKEDIKAKQVDNQFRLSEAILRMDEAKERINGLKGKNAFQLLQNGMYNQLTQSQIDMNNAQTEMTKTMREGQLTINLLKSKELSVFDENHKNQVAETLSRIALNTANVELSDAQIFKLVAEEEQIRTAIKGMDLDNQVKERTMNDLVGRVKAERIKAQFDALPDEDKYYWSTYLANRSESEKLSDREYAKLLKNTSKFGKVTGNLTGLSSLGRILGK